MKLLANAPKATLRRMGATESKFRVHAPEPAQSGMRKAAPPFVRVLLVGFTACSGIRMALKTSS
jgi:hypothetical protein